MPGTDCRPGVSLTIREWAERHAKGIPGRAAPAEDGGPGQGGTPTGTATSGLRPSQLIEDVRNIRKALVACAVCGWLAVGIHCLMQWMLKRGG